MGRKNYKVVTVALAFAFSACVKDKPDKLMEPGTNAIADRLYVVCEGSLGNGNSSLGMYDLQSGHFFEDVYKAANNTQVGDVLQSLTEIDGNLFLCVNNSDKILVVNKAEHKLLAEIPVPKPRYITVVSPTKAYVSTLFSNRVYIINPAAMSVTGSFTLPAQNAEKMLLHKGSLYACGWDTASDNIFKIDTATNKVVQHIEVAGRAPQAILEDKNSNLWVLSGNVHKGKQSALTCINDVDGAVIKSYRFPPKADAIKPVFNTSRDVMYFIEVNYNGATDNNGIYRMGIYDSTLPPTPLIPAKQYQYFWALGIEEATGNLYVGDPKGFIQKGSVQVYDTNGNFVKEWSTGVGPGHFYFLKK
jgi:DNA-binding beta-propeller fold protein YncE